MLDVTKLPLIIDVERGSSHASLPRKTIAVLLMLEDDSKGHKVGCFPELLQDHGDS